MSDEAISRKDSAADSVYTDQSYEQESSRKDSGRGEDSNSDKDIKSTERQNKQRSPTIASDVTPGEIVKRGFLSKKARAKFIRPWALRSVVLDDRFHLFYYDREQLKGVINLIGTGIRHVPPEQADNRRFAFEITNINDIKTTKHHKASSLLLAAGSQQEADDWVEAIHLILRKVNSSINMEYESFEEVAKGNVINPVDVKRLKQQRKLKQMEADEDFDEEFEEDLFLATNGHQSPLPVDCSGKENCPNPL